jgi:adenylosuccinate synthase
LSGHTIYHNGKKYVTHYIPSGVFHGIKSIIGPGCVVNLEKLEKEIQELEAGGIAGIRRYLFIDKRAHITLNGHISEDADDSDKNWGNARIGTTKSGNGPTYRDKYGRRGQRLIDWINNVKKQMPIFSEEGRNQFALRIDTLESMLIDVYEEFHNGKLNTILCEGAQGFELDIDWGDYPYVTSSHCGIGSAVLNGIPPKSIRNVYGVIKAYETYVGAKAFQNSDLLCEKFQEFGEEVGATTGRVRQTNYLHMPRLQRAIKMNDITTLIVNKCDIFEKACLSTGPNQFPWRNEHYIKYESSFEMWKIKIQNLAFGLGVPKVFFSSSPHEI